MLILAIDTTTNISSAALTEDSKLIAQYTLIKTLTHSETLLPMVQNMLQNTHTGIHDIDMFACSIGPGSFTGIRIGVATIKGLAFGLNKPCVGVSTLEALTYNFNGFMHDSIICPVMDARRGQFYNALFNNGKRLTPDRAITPADLMIELGKYTLPVYFTGDGYSLAHETIKLPSVCESPELTQYQNAYCTAAAAYRQYTHCPGAYSDSDLSPVYLRSSQAERTTNEKPNNT